MRALLLVALAALTLAACGDDDEAEVVEPDADLQVRVDGMAFDQDRYELPAGTSTVALIGDSGTTHTLLVHDLRLEVDGTGTDTGTVTLELGTYTIYCDVPGHQDSGMEAELVVTPATP